MTAVQKIIYLRTDQRIHKYIADQLSVLEESFTNGRSECVTGRDTDSKDRALTAALWLEGVENGHKKSGKHIVFKSLRQETQLSVSGML